MDGLVNDMLVGGCVGLIVGLLVSIYRNRRQIFKNAKSNISFSFFSNTFVPVFLICLIGGMVYNVLFHTKLKGELSGLMMAELAGSALSFTVIPLIVLIFSKKIFWPMASLFVVIILNYTAVTNNYSKENLIKNTSTQQKKYRCNTGENLN